MYDRILVPLDGSQLAEHVLPHARLLAKALDAPVGLLVCIMGPIETGEYGRNLRAAAENYVASMAESLQKDGLKASGAVVHDDPADAIVNEAEKTPHTLIAMSTHGRSGVTRWALGSVTSKVLHSTSTPLLVLRPPEDQQPVKEARFSTIVVPLDESAVAEQALPHAVFLAKRLDLGIVLVSATPSPADYYKYGGFPGLATVDFSEDVDSEAQGYLQGIREQLRQEGITREEERLLHGDAASAIIDVAADVPHSLVVMTTHGRSGIGRWILGSVTDKVASHAGTPVLVIRALES